MDECLAKGNPFEYSYGWTDTPLPTWIALLVERVLSQFRQCSASLGSRFIAIKPR